MLTFPFPLVACEMAAAPGACQDVGVVQLPQTRAVPRVGRRQNCGGYDCELVSPPPDAIQAECPICLLIPKEPCVISCKCGKEFCRECIERIKEDNKPCPLCNESEFTFLRHHGSERNLKALNVWCSGKKLGCQWKGKLGNFEQHLNDECLLTEVSCPFAFAGCEVKLPRKDMPAHTADISAHFSLASLTQEIEQKQRATERQFTEKQEALEQQFEEKQEAMERKFGEKLEALERQFEEKMKVTEKQYELLLEKQRATQSQNQILLEKLNDTERKVLMLEDTQRMKSKFPIDFQVTFERKDIYLPPFFTHPHGYKMCVFVCPNGTGDGEGTHVSVFTCLMQGPFDDQLKWPFRGEVTIQIVNQAGNHSHVGKTIVYNEKTQHDAAGRVTGKETRAHGWGHQTFLAHTDLSYSLAKFIHFMKDNIIIFRVVRVSDF